LSKYLDDLKPEVARKARDFLAAMTDLGERVVVTSTLRTDIEQLAMYAQGRAQGTEGLKVVNALRMMAGLRSLAKAENEYTISRCDGQTTHSKHQSGDAFDAVILAKDGKPIWKIEGEDIERYKTLGVIAKAHGLTWGGDWPPINPATGIGFDPYHMEL
jgi:hypothetical protein